MNDMDWRTYVERYPGAVIAGAALAGLVAGWLTGRADAVDGSMARASWQRLGSRVETLMNRVIDEVADATERALIPALTGGVQTLFERRDARDAMSRVRSTVGV
jgi:hypothetical protein